MFHRFKEYHAFSSILFSKHVCQSIIQCAKFSSFYDMIAEISKKQEKLSFAANLCKDMSTPTIYHLKICGKSRQISK